MGCMQSAEESSAAAPRRVAMEGVKVLLFDLDDTLYQNGGATEKRLMESIEAYVTERLGLKPGDARALYKEYGTVLHGLLQTGKIQENQVEDYLTAVHDISLKEVLCRPEVRDLLQSLRGTTNWVFTASIRKHAERCLKKLKLEGVFRDRIIDAHDVEYRSKHDVVAFKKALATAKASPKEAMLFDDSVKNIQTAKSLGMKTCLVGRYARDTGEEVVCEEADFIVDDLLDIKTAIPGLFTTKQQKSASRRSSALVAAKPELLDMDIDSQSVASSVLEVQQAQAKTKTNRVVVVLGGPGSGKGTQCQRIVDTFEGVTHLSAGDLLRQELADPTSTNATLIAKYIKEGKIVPSEVTMNLIVQAMESSENSVFFIDGCPRDAQNLKSFYDVIIDSGKAICVGVLVYDCSEEAMLERILERGKTSGRTDDNIESTMKRFKTFRNETMPVVGALRNRYRVTTIDAARDIDAVFETTKSTVQKLLDGSKDY